MIANKFDKFSTVYCQNLYKFGTSIFPCNRFDNNYEDDLLDETVPKRRRTFLDSSCSANNDDSNNNDDDEDTESHKTGQMKGTIIFFLILIT